MPPTESRSPCTYEVEGDECTEGKSSHGFSAQIARTCRNGHDRHSESAIHQGETALLSRSRQRPPEVLQHLVTPARFDPLRRVA